MNPTLEPSHFDHAEAIRLAVDELILAITAASDVALPEALRRTFETRAMYAGQMLPYLKRRATASRGEVARLQVRERAFSDAAFLIRAEMEFRNIHKRPGEPRFEEVRP